jgi:F-type H+-transporting ATPase subunit alpha
VVVVWAGTSGFLDDVPVEDVARFEEEFLDSVQRNHKGIYDAIRETGELSDDTTTALKDAIDEFRKEFQVSGGEALVKDEEPAEPIAEDEEGRDKLNKYVEPQPGQKPSAEKK